ncbi:hypothetical protein V5O48_002076 [Marasmius crinis-equi]|uniref:AB hydrolase-1 domain-containing protein n=1 Tax=Marasmius crinis-equi TaxID=585013 RepID=A0ABR3FWZ0_9AGAR
MSSQAPILHLIYVHGFQGNDTTFQSFPTHLHKYLSERVPLRHNLQVQSTIYPTYQSRKPLSNATRNFLQWLSTQPPGPVILIGHSMGGLLVAEAATDPEMSCKRHRRVVGMIAFDCPYLGMHPRVILSGIASLFAKAPKTEGRTEQEMNPDPGVTVVDNTVTDGWEEFKKNLPKDDRSRLSLESAQTSNTLEVPPSSPSSSHRSHSNSSLELHVPSSRSHSTSSVPSFVDRTINFIQTHGDNSMVKWLKKHRQNPFTDGKVWVMEHYQFGSCMFDPSGLTNRYKRLVAWNGFWVNYWTTAMPSGSPSSSPSSSRSSSPTSDQVHAALLEPDSEAAARMLQSSFGESSSHPSSPRHSRDSSTSSLFSTSSQSVEGERRTAETYPPRPNKLRRDSPTPSSTPKPVKEKTGRHFVVLPNGVGAVLGGFDKWEKVDVAGAQDVVAAHCGIFFPNQNLEYEALVDRVGRRVLDWCEKL